MGRTAAGNLRRKLRCWIAASMWAGIAVNARSFSYYFFWGGAACRCIHVRSTRKPENEVSRTQHPEIPDLGSSPQRILPLWKCPALMGIAIFAAFLYSGGAFECCWDWRPGTVLLTDIGQIGLVQPHPMFHRSQISIT